MTVSVIKPGLQSTLQSRPRIGLRHLGVPAGGAADPLSLALANKLVGNQWDTPALEVTGTNAQVRQRACVRCRGCRCPDVTERRRNITARNLFCKIRG